MDNDLNATKSISPVFKLKARKRVPEHLENIEPTDKLISRMFIIVVIFTALALPWIKGA